MTVGVRIATVDAGASAASQKLAAEDRWCAVTNDSSGQRDAGTLQRVGGQAVIEGVMMRAGDGACVAVRRPDGRIETRRLPNPGWADATRSVPLARGIAGLAESLSIGVQALRWSERCAEPDASRRPAPAWMLLLVAVAAVLVLVVVVPATIAGLFPTGSVWFVLAETASRLAAIGGYLALVSRRHDVRRVFQYHGAEHLVVAAHEAGRDLSPASVRSGSIRHPRCGTSFLLVVAGVAAVLHPFLPTEPLVGRMLARVIMAPVVVAISYELLTHLGRIASAAPGGLAERLLLWPQRFTTREPDDAQIEVAAAALEGALETALRPGISRGAAVQELEDHSPSRATILLDSI